MTRTPLCLRAWLPLAVAILLLGRNAAAEPLERTPLFRFAATSDVNQPGNMLVRDLNGDGAAEVITCARGAVAILTGDGAGGLMRGWVSEARGCTAVAVGDANVDGQIDVIAALATPANAPAFFAIYDPRTIGPAYLTMQVPGTSPVNDVAFGDVDGDGQPEIVAVTDAATYVYASRTFGLKWTAMGKGGTRVAIGNLDGDARNEIVVNGPVGRILDAAMKREKTGWIGGFGWAMTLGDVDSDGRDEIVYLPSFSASATILDGDTLQTRTITLPESPSGIAVADANHDGAAEIVITPSQFGDVEGVLPANGSVLWKAASAVSAGGRFGVGDVIPGGPLEVVWSFGDTYSATYLAAPGAATPWRSVGQDATFGGVVADLDGDGKLEVVVRVRTTAGTTAPGILQVFDYQSRTVKWTLVPTMDAFDNVEVGQFDADPALEILVGGTYHASGAFAIFDGATGQQQTTPTPAVALGPRFVRVANVDADNVDEILTFTGGYELVALDGATLAIQKNYGALDDVTVDIAVADVNHDGAKDIAAVTGHWLYVYDAVTGTQRAHIRTDDGYPLTHVAATADGTGFVATLTMGGYVTVYDAAFAPVWQCRVGPLANLSALTFTRVDGALRLAVGSTAGNLNLYPLTAGACPTPEVDAGYGRVSALDPVDVNADGQPELVVSADYGFEIDALRHLRCIGAACASITFGNASTTSGGVSLGGTVASPVPVRELRYELSGATAGNGPVLRSGSSWSVGPLTLAPGMTTVTLIATDTSDNAAVQSLSIVSNASWPGDEPPTRSTPAQPAPHRRRAAR